jgi:hypothetical protein
VELVERRELGDNQRLSFGRDGCQCRPDHVGKTGGAVVLAHFGGDIDSCIGYDGSPGESCGTV